MGDRDVSGQTFDRKRTNVLKKAVQMGMNML